jgi:hypothetical protein
MGLPKHFIKHQILKAQHISLSNRAAARYLNCSYNTYKLYAKQYIDETTGKTLFEKHLNQHGKGINKFLSKKGKEAPLDKILDGTIPRHSFTAEKIKQRLLQECVLNSECYKCGFHERRVSDMKQPFLLNFKDGNKNNWNKSNLEILCYNCYYLYVDDVFNVKEKQHIEDTYHPTEKSQPTWELDGWMLDHFKNIGLEDDNGGDTDEQYISRL